MLISKINSQKPENKIIAQAAKIIKQGGVVIYPTETAYGLAVDFFNPSAIAKIFKIKKRPMKKKLIIIAANFKMAEKYFHFSATEKKIAKKYWPGPLTLILKSKFKKRGYPKEVGVRISSSAIAKILAQKSKTLITATSANLSGKPACYSAKEVLKQFSQQKHQPDLILDSGRLPPQKASTIIKIKKNNKLEIIRQGEIKLSNRQF